MDTRKVDLNGTEDEIRHAEALVNTVVEEVYLLKIILLANQLLFLLANQLLLKFLYRSTLKGDCVEYQTIMVRERWPNRNRTTPTT